MSNPSVTRIRASFELLAPRGAEIVDAFYTKLFQTAPSVRALFPSDLRAQKQHLLAALALVVKHADNLPSLAAPLHEMGARHLRYGAQEAHYGVVRDTLLATLAEFAGAKWTAELNADWTGALNAVASVMLEGARAAEQAA
jgi:hemoglobin-like flavoprotein